MHDCDKGACLLKLGGFCSENRGGGRDGLVSVEALASHKERVDVAVFSPCSQLIATGSHDQTVRIWNASTGACTKVLKGHRGDITALVFTKHSDTILSTCTDLSCGVWDIASGISCVFLAMFSCQTLTHTHTHTHTHTLMTHERNNALALLY